MDRAAIAQAISDYLWVAVVSSSSVILVQMKCFAAVIPAGRRPGGLGDEVGPSIWSAARASGD
jgi:hypothetical protein